MAVRSYRSRMRIAAALAVAATMAVGFIGGRVARVGEPGEQFWFVFPALLAIFALGFAGVTPWWRKLDDMHRTGHLVSYYWGGMAGAVVVMMGLIAATGVHSDLSRGALYTILGQGVGFLVALALWRLRRGRPAA